MGLLMLLLMLPLLYLVYRLMRIALAREPHSRADEVYRAALYRFHMAGIERDNETPLDYARAKVDPAFGADFEEFMRLYLRLKYAGGGVRPGDTDLIDRFVKTAGSGIHKKNGFIPTLLSYFNVVRAIRYFQQPEKPFYENQSI